MEGMEQCVMQTLNNAFKNITAYSVVVVLLRKKQPINPQKNKKQKTTNNNNNNNKRRSEKSKGSYKLPMIKATFISVVYAIK